MDFFFTIAGAWLAIEWLEFVLRDDNSTDVPKQPKKHWWVKVCRTRGTTHFKKV